VVLGAAIVFSVVLVGMTAFFIDLGITRMRPHFLAWYSSAAFVFASFSISMMNLWGHFTNYRNPKAYDLVTVCGFNAINLIPPTRAGNALSFAS
jgi:hypothetical protein